MKPMLAYALLARCLYLTLAGQNDDGDLEWIGTHPEWGKVFDYECKHESHDL